MSEHYNEYYFSLQEPVGAFGGLVDLVKFKNYISPDMNVLEFGCGGGFLLNKLNCKGKIGVEINDEARKSVNRLGIESFKFVKDAPDNWADCILSNHAFEHVPDPMNQLLLLKSKLKKGGRIIFVIPCESYRCKYIPNNIHNHLYTWSPMNLGNLFTEAGYHVIESKSFFHKWPPYYEKVYKFLGRHVFHMICSLYGYIRTSSVQVRIVAEKP